MGNIFCDFLGDISPIYRKYRRNIGDISEKYRRYIGDISEISVKISEIYRDISGYIGIYRKYIQMTRFEILT